MANTINLVITPRVMEKAIKKNGLQTMLEILPRETRHHLTYDRQYGKEVRYNG